uniref:Uncharacterized protein n=1 Tax=Timspurckia oligopyrenoides TaxID=708627 RepID=A0A7S0ZK09_9RHOD|mmetsp:Transcript_8188/g.14830  ORF Transcript_8188/g.14830 Transcript_8188/m.14830 type:complete len:523 (+) Transcript_8188:205-1773(+)|eukprot:CAMPEP_0182441764 /NCGR_PEP_ID=MMETSP1172-20130603/767_1 /TAXON_ID=708627 /ORGANISM="Timspurckia oligopyrenoides, Strain CCMP3278" /LENGTH=522 /DNA_ID=CAMNT_0024636285 /DNA_START=140 /DNA_END=1708 /DNA_ORIENTATION=+
MAARTSARNPRAFGGSRMQSTDPKLTTNAAPPKPGGQPPRKLNTLSKLSSVDASYSNEDDSSGLLKMRSLGGNNSGGEFTKKTSFREESQPDVMRRNSSQRFFRMLSKSDVTNDETPNARTSGRLTLPRLSSSKKLEAAEVAKVNEDSTQSNMPKFEPLPQNQGIQIGNTKSLANLKKMGSFKAFETSDTSAPQPEVAAPVQAEHSKEFMQLKAKKMNEYSAPAVVMMQFPHPKHWSVDLFSWPHNAIRMEISELYHIISSMDRMFLDLEHEDIDDLFTWLNVFFSFIEDYWQFEYEHLLKRVEQKRLVEPAIMKERNAMRSKVCKSIVTLQVNRDNKYEFLPAGECMKEIRNFLNKICTELFVYFRFEVRKYAKAIERNSVKTDWADTSKDMFKFFMNGKLPELSPQILMRWIPDGKLQAQLVRKHFTSVTKFNSWSIKLYKEHTSIVEEFYKRSEQVVNENAAAVAERVPQSYLKAVAVREELDEFDDDEDYDETAEGYEDGDGEDIDDFASDVDEKIDD